MSEYDRALFTMGESGIQWIDWVFRWCVVLLVELANVLNITYEELNVYLFVFLLPALLLASVTLNVYFVTRKYVWAT